jgi:hypothetical protein
MVGSPVGWSNIRVSPFSGKKTGNGLAVVPV